MKRGINLDAISIVLVRPKFPENIGAVARVMKNMGLSRLTLVDGCSPLHANAYKVASGAEDILERAEELPSLTEAISDTACVVGTTSREGEERGPLFSPRDLVRELIPLSIKNSIALVFGSEREGLTNEELSHCHLYVRIPSSTAFPSLNLSHAVMILCYELFQSNLPIEERPSELAKTEDLGKMFDHMEKTLIDIGFLDVKHPAPIMRVLRRLFGRSQMNPREVQILHGIWSKMDWQMRRKR
jgi:TrmH family RNA methyltransferase